MNKIFIIFCIFLQAQYIKSDTYDLLDDLKISNRFIENDVKFERIYDRISNNISIIEFFESQTNENVAIEVIIRMRSPSSPFQLIQIGNDDTKSLIKITLYSQYEKSTLEILIKDLTEHIFFNYNIMTKKFLDGRWHKIVIKFNEAVPQAYFDCALLQTDSDLHKSFTLTGTKLPITIGIVNRGSMVVDINSFNMHINKLFELNVTCEDVESFNNLNYENSKEINILKEFFNSSAPSVHTFGDKFQKELTIPNSFVTNYLKNFTIEIVFRMNFEAEMSSDDLKSITLLEMRDEIYNVSFLYQIGNKMIMTTEYNDLAPSTNFHGLEHKMDIFDGKWHKLIYFYSRDNDEFSSIWVDCNMIYHEFGSRFNGYSSVLQNVTIMHNLSERKLENFEVRRFKIYADFDTNLKKYCSEIS